MQKQALILLLFVYSVKCSPSFFSTSWLSTSRPSNPAWDLEVEGAESNEQTNTQTDTVVEGGGEPQQVDGQEVPVPVQQTDSLQQTENVQQESVVASQQTGTEQQQSEQVTNSVEDPAQNVVPVAVVNEGLTQNSDQSPVVVDHSVSQETQQAVQEIQQTAQEIQQTAQEAQQTVQETQQTAQETQQTVEQNDQSLQAIQPQVVADPLNGSTMTTSDNQNAVANTLEQTSDVQQQSYLVDQQQTSSDNQVVVVQQETAKEVQQGQVGGSTPLPSSSSGILASQESQGSPGPTEQTSAVTASDDGYEIEDNYNIQQDSNEQDIVEKIKEIEEAEESEAESARWADAIATSQVIAFIVIAMVAVVVVYVLYIARKKSKERDVEKEYRNLLQEDYDSDDEKMLRKKRYG
ncbi:hypothetical protein ACHWQZ_G009597 [Mnemiopsis leidyi]